MNDELVKDIADSILDIERKSIRRRKDVINTSNKFSGVNKADADVVNAIIAVLEDGGSNENQGN